ncbi:MAG: hypothetical protein HFJ75_05175 [Eggerthellaceae bacterium]|nr:hypothetical protein [Eggerthellaceae bacterium]
MNTLKMTRIFSLALAGLCVAALLVLAGCASPRNPATEAQTANRQYMAQVNQTMDDLALKLDGFQDAVARGDVVTMRTEADKAFKVLDSLEAIDAPEALTEVKQDYVDGCASLREALDGYIALYTEVSSATEDHPFDFATYDQRVKDIQDTYDQGIESLQAGDGKAVSL